LPNDLCSYFFWKNGKITMSFVIFGQKYTESHQKIAFFVKKGDFEPQYFTLRTIEEHGNYEPPKCSKDFTKFEARRSYKLCCYKKRRV